MSNSLDFQLHAAAVVAPGLESLAQLRAIQQGAQTHEPVPLVLRPPPMLPAAERRRASQAVRLVLACIEQVLQASAFPVEALHSVFATDEGTGEVCQQMLGTLATTRQVSPLLFANSVVNAPAGYFSIAWRNRMPSTVVSLGLESFASGLLCAASEAHATGAPVLLVAYDPPMTAPMDELLAVREPTATAWIIHRDAAAQDAAVLASFRLGVAQSDSPGSALPQWMPPAWNAHSSARGIAALALLDGDESRACRLALGRQMLTLRRVGGASDGA